LEPFPLGEKNSGNKVFLNAEGDAVGPSGNEIPEIGARDEIIIVAN